MADNHEDGGYHPLFRITGKNLAKKMVAVSSDLGWIEKSGKNAEQGYKYVTEADVLAAVRAAMNKHGVAFYPEAEPLDWYTGQTKSGTTTYGVKLIMRGVFVDTDTGESHEASAIGMGVDTQDKAPYKAMTGAMKYLLSKTFLLPMGDDPEGDKPSEGHATPKNDAAFEKIMKAFGGKIVEEAILEVGVKDWNTLVASKQDIKDKVYLKAKELSEKTKETKTK